MQLNKISSKKLLPIIISSGIVSSFAFTYNSIDNSIIDSSISNQKAEEFLNYANDTYYSTLSLKSIFKERLHLWRKNTMFCSFADQIIEDKNFKAIVSFGEPVVPFIMEEINEFPSNLVWALNFIYNKKITNNPNTTIEQACKLWINAMR